ncbi:hypothetical protein WAK64_07830 [Bacillus spongiae]|uniref:Uncharacterized protein n=1 Tax=Bacillus spongiae TaxID=2683610 RepID=A0ABU8HCG6_9BACI
MGDETIKPYFEKITINSKVNTNESHERINELQVKVDKRCSVYTTFEAAGVELVPNWTKA